MEVYDAAMSLCRAMLIAWTIGFCMLMVSKKISGQCKDIRMPPTFRMVGEFWHWCVKASPDEDRVVQQMDDRRTQRMQVVVIAALIVTSLTGILTIYTILTGKPRWYTAWMDGAAIVMSLITILFNVQPVLLSSRPNLFYSTWMLWIALHVSPAVNVIDPMFNDALFTVRIVLSMAILDMRAIILWNVVYGLAAWCQFVFVWQDFQCAAVQLGGFVVAVKEIISCSLIVAICYSYQQGIVSQIRDKMGASASKRECRAVSALLRSMSDVVVKLDSSLRVMGHCPRLATLLLRESVRNSYFEDFLFAEEDKQWFHDCIETSEEAETEYDVCVPWRVRLRDGVGSCVTAECFHTELEDVAGKRFHVIGVRELQVDAEEEAKAATERGPISRPARCDSGPATPVTVQTQPMPPDLFLQVILQESCGIPASRSIVAATSGRQVPPSGSSSNDSPRSTGSRQSIRSRQSSRSSTSRSPRMSNRACLSSRVSHWNCVRAQLHLQPLVLRAPAAGVMPWGHHSLVSLIHHAVAFESVPDEDTLFNANVVEMVHDGRGWTFLPPEEREVNMIELLDKHEPPSLQAVLAKMNESDSKMELLDSAIEAASNNVQRAMSESSFGFVGLQDPFYVTPPLLLAAVAPRVFSRFSAAEEDAKDGRATTCRPTVPRSVATAGIRRFHSRGALGRQKITERWISAAARSGRCVLEGGRNFELEQFVWIDCETRGHRDTHIVCASREAS